VIVGQLGEYNGHGVALMLAKDPRIEVVAHDLEATALADASVQYKPHVAVVNLDTEAELRERLRSDSAQTEMLVLASDPAVADGILLLAAGVACVPLRTSPDRLTATVHRLAHGERIFLTLSGKLFTDTASLTPRELEVLAHLSHGRSPNAIALLMQIQIRTVRYYTESLRNKLGVRTTRALVAATHKA
jgi:DNA-binding NarL/FixJ family response regulator